MQIRVNLARFCPAFVRLPVYFAPKMSYLRAVSDRQTPCLFVPVRVPAYMCARGPCVCPSYLPRILPVLPSKSIGKTSARPFYVKAFTGLINRFLGYSCAYHCKHTKEKVYHPPKIATARHIFPHETATARPCSVPLSLFRVSLCVCCLLLCVAVSPWLLWCFIWRVRVCFVFSLPHVRAQKKRAQTARPFIRVRLFRGACKIVF